MAKNEAEIKKEVEDQLFWDSMVDSTGIEVEVENNSVTLKGSVPTYSQRSRAFTDAYSVVGVFMVDNELEVEPEEAIELPTDDEIKTMVQNSLIMNSDIDETDVEIEVEAGWVTLKGTVDAIWKKVIVEDEASTIGGVLGVTNELAVVPTEDVVDKDIAEDIVNSLERNVNVNVDNVDVKVEDGEVTLTGSVPTWRARTSAYDAALYTTGVTSVEDDLVITG